MNLNESTTLIVIAITVIAQFLFSVISFCLCLIRHKKMKKHHSCSTHKEKARDHNPTSWSTDIIKNEYAAIKRNKKKTE